MVYQTNGEKEKATHEAGYEVFRKAVIDHYATRMVSKGSPPPVSDSEAGIKTSNPNKAPQDGNIRVPTPSPNPLSALGFPPFTSVTEKAKERRAGKDMNDAVQPSPSVKTSSASKSPILNGKRTLDQCIIDLESDCSDQWESGISSKDPSGGKNIHNGHPPFKRTKRKGTFKKNTKPRSKQRTDSTSTQPDEDLIEPSEHHSHISFCVTLVSDSSTGDGNQNSATLSGVSD
ncbi:hypothetical protein M501DRAFT_1012180 [Patellaria atrata CBS 101060]|uniref:Uncharacterized protein n=1 Tax=Patellaria atrata CBS 101060 TaxID=1346257 RepID=A0A9P4SHJ4_9PEZI|nr:hypothetical protein M501DRAFT_1012180 [Patellaria atrata CBS 101060]